MGPDDTPRLVPLDRSNWRAALDVLVTDEQLPLVADHQPVALVVLAKAYVQPDGRRCQPLGFAAANGSMLAVLALSHSGSVSEINNFAVDHRHQRTGVGTAALRSIFDWCRGEGSTAVELTVNPINEPAMALYRSVGMRPTGETRRGEPVLRIDLDTLLD